jgi:hypothetical protein
VQSIRTKALVADISLGVGLVAAAGATVLYVLHVSKSPSKEVATTTLDVSPVPGGAYAWIGQRF